MDQRRNLARVIVAPLREVKGGRVDPHPGNVLKGLGLCPGAKLALYAELERLDGGGEDVLVFVGDPRLDGEIPRPDVDLREGGVAMWRQKRNLLAAGKGYRGRVAIGDMRD